MRFALCCIAILSMGMIARSQTTFGSLAGTVTDPAGAVAAGVQVTVTNLGTNEKRGTVTNTDGIYRFVNLQPGSYRLDAGSKGFKHFTRSPIDVQVDQSYRIDIPLQIGDVSE